MIQHGPPTATPSDRLFPERRFSDRGKHGFLPNGSFAVESSAWLALGHQEPARRRTHTFGRAALPTHTRRDARATLDTTLLVARPHAERDSAPIAMRRLEVPHLAAAASLSVLSAASCMRHDLPVPGIGRP